MAEERDPQVSKRYRELGAEEPPRALDQAILAAARRAVDSRPAPLVVPAGRRRWYFPVAAAAVITLAVAVTVQVERQRPDEAVIASAPVQERKEQQVLKEQSAKAQEESAQARSAPKPARAPQGFTPEPTPAPPATPAPAPAPQAADAMRDLAKSNEAASPPQGARPAEAPAQARSRSDVQERAAGQAAPPVATQSAPARSEMRSSRSHPDIAPEAALGAAREPLYRTGMPETWIEHIAQLRKQGKDDEAERELADFRKRHPDFRMSDETRAKVEKSGAAK